MTLQIETIGNATLYLADCKDEVDEWNTAGLIFTSPPYNCGMNYKGYEDNLPLEQFSEFLTETIFAKKARAYAVNVGQYIGSRSDRVLFRDVLLDAAGWIPLVDEVIWDKGPANGAAWGNYPNSPRIRAQHESIFLFGSATMPNGNGLSWAEWSALTSSIWRVSANVDLKTHPAMMPVEIARRAVALWSDTSETVLDPFMGSGTTGVACISVGRSFIGIEREPEYFDIACRRIEEAYKQPRLFDEPPPKAVQEPLI